MASAKQFNYPVWTMVVREKSGGPTLQEQLFIQLRRLIVNGQLARGARFPASRSMATDLAISRNTVNMAYDRLAAEGYIKRRPSSGFYVEESLPEDSVRPGGERGPPPSSLPVALSARGREASIRHWSWSRQDKFDLSPGMPALDIFPYKQFGKIAANYWRRFTVSDLGYGEGGGLAALRQQLAIYLSEARGIRCEADQIIVVGSTLQAANLVAHVLLDAGDVVGVEDPAYATLLSTQRSAGLRLSPVPVSRDGLNADDIAHRAADARMILVSPVGQFAAGATMSEAAACLSGLLAGKCDLISALMSITEERLQSINFSVPYRSSAARFVGLKTLDAKPVTDAGEPNPEGVAGKTIGLQRSSTYAKYIAEKYPQATVSEYDKVDNMILDLQAGRVDLIFAGPIKLDNDFLSKPEGKDYGFVGPEIDDASYFGPGIGIGIRKADEDLLKNVDGALTAMFKDGNFKAINDKYWSFSVLPAAAK